MIRSTRFVQVGSAFAFMVAGLLVAGSGNAKASDDKEAKRAKIDAMAKETLAKLTSENAGAKKLFADAEGYAVFDNWQTSLALAGGSGTGVAVKVSTGAKTYMKMKTVGLKVGLGIQKCQVVFLFQTEKRLKEFVENGWEAEAGADAAAGDQGVNLAPKFSNGLAIYQITEKGIMLSVDISGTKYYPARNLN